MPHFESDGLKIHYEIHGEGDPVLLLHGFASNGRVNWVSTSWTKALADAGFRAIVMDHRGHGESDKPHDPEAYSAPLMAEDARRLLDHLGIGKADVMGYSMGARVAAFLAIRHPQRVRSLVLSGMAANLLKGVKDSDEIADALEADSPEEIRSPKGRAFRQFAERVGGDLKALAACMRAGRVPVDPDALRALPMPVLVTVGSRDEIAGPPEPLLRHMPQATAFVIPGRDHMNAVGDRNHKQAVVEFLRSRP